MPRIEVKLDQLLQEVHKDQVFQIDDRILFVEVSNDCFVFATVKYCRWHNFAIESYVTYPEWQQFYAQAADGNALQQPLNSFLVSENVSRADKYVCAYLLGSLADQVEIKNELNLYFKLEFSPVRQALESYFPRSGTQLTRSLTARSIQSPYRLSLLLSEFVEEKNGPRLTIMPQTVFNIGDKLIADHQVHPRAIQLRAPVLHDSFLLVFREDDENEHFVQDVVYIVRAKKHEIRIAIVWNGDICDWQLRYNADEIEKVERVVQVHHGPLSPPEITMEASYPSVAFVIESTLGIYAKAKEMNNDGNAVDLVADKLTSFETVYTLYRKILDALGWATALRYAVLFYGDQEPAPPEFDPPERFPSGHPVRFVPKQNGKMQFVPLDELETVLSEDQFMMKQSYSVDWYKSLEEASAFLRKSTPWGAGERIAIWIGQSPAHKYVHSMSLEEHTGDYTSNIDFAKELKSIQTQAHVKNIALFVENDILDSRMRNEAETIWRMIGINNFRKIDLSDPHSPALDKAAGWVGSTVASYTNHALERRSVYFQFPRQTRYLDTFYWALTHVEGHENIVFKYDREGRV